MTGVHTVQPTLKLKVLALVGSTLACLLLLVTAEAFVRLFLKVNVLGNSEELFVSHAFGESRGNAKNTEAISFGTKVFTDKYGFRVNAQRTEKNNQTAILFLGDSIGFGGGVEENKTFVGLLRERLPDTTIYNSCVIGYAIANYKDVVEMFVPQHKEIKKAYLSFALNDLSDKSAEAIHQFLGDAPRKDIVERARAIPMISAANDFLRTRSKLYLFVKEKLTDPSQTYFLKDLALYSMEEERFQRIMRPLLDIDRELKEKGIEFTVVIMPEEPQLESGDSSYLIPQKRLSKYFEEHHIRSIDVMSGFKRAKPPKSAFLYGDPFHFSEIGHRLVFDVLYQDLQNSGRKSP